ncbi:2-oxoglutarate dehydrogenase complex dihydrolipoyllysine-residue succinyltransferase [Azospirillum humicireducens]|uniref:Dihydrolipoyllysine-residue succinyltransferase component of 2-oxoglutarate dehydrogenase complex n=1 Tax=Azospirillum humicireducens TaxID=1226968 RepID=A0A160JD11_9PROT|nr:2-oxoglutarate dehydrogenase complex dihydrolipoyllysine-residue succinyltransferase [Azospirillum humicireducens]ANC90563.1 2-oxoglutarate dehydrogenase complex dihydrolipoyllysine-residue succinyltransferase [Azospirillum humicireducens]
MATDIKVPTLGESVSEATVARWLKKAGEAVAMDEALVELETDKVTLEVNAPAAGVLAEIVAPEGANVEVGALLGVLTEGASAGAAPAAAAPAPAAAAPAAAPAPAAAAPGNLAASGPAARKLADEKGIDGSSIAGSGKDGRVTKGDVLAAPAPAAKPAAPAPAPKVQWAAGTQGDRPRAAQEERVRMTRLRQRIAERLKEAQNSAAMLTTFNEVDMSAAIALRAEYKDYFEKRHKVRLGFMSFFVKAAVQALKEIPAVNAEIDGTDIVYKNYYDIGVAVGTPQGLVVPVVRDADKLDFAGVEGTIAALGKKGRDGKLSMDELTGGTFTISNGGVYGSLMSTPIINPPQSAILGMHKTMDRAVVVGGKIEIRPMMYLALSYDHRIIDGKEAVTFLVRIKELIEDPRRLLLDV